MGAPGVSTPPGIPARRRWSRLASASTLLLAGAALVVASSFVGTVPIPPAAVFSVLTHPPWIANSGAAACNGAATTARLCSAYVQIVWDERIPSILLALSAGAALGVSGATLQGVFRNPLVDPYLLGLSSGAAVGAASVFVLGIGIAAANLTVPLFGFLGALLTGAIILVIAGRRRGSPETLLLTGVALGYLFSGVLALLLLYNPFGSLQVSFWLLGGLSGATWDRDAIALGGVLVAGAILSLEGREINLLQLGTEVAQSLGVDVRRVRVRLVLLASFATALAVAFTGVIGFVGLVSPHVVRRLMGPDYRTVVPFSAVAGGLYLVVAYDLSQVILPATVVPVGILTAFAGAPFFLILLHRRRKAEREAEGGA
jgi:iron complex transport system permease protein